MLNAKIKTNSMIGNIIFAIFSTFCLNIAKFKIMIKSISYVQFSHINHFFKLRGFLEKHI